MRYKNMEVISESESSLCKSFENYNHGKIKTEKKYMYMRRFKDRDIYQKNCNIINEKNERNL